MNTLIYRSAYHIKHLPDYLHNLVFDSHPELLIDFRVKYFLRHKMHKLDHNGITFRQDLDDNFKEFLTDDERKDSGLIKQLEYDLAKCYILYGITPDEYFMHDFRNRTPEYRATILSRLFKDSLCMRYMGSETRKYFSQLKDKWQFYQLAKPWFKRDVCRVETQSDLGGVIEFCKKHSRFIAKPRLASCGIGVHIVDLEKTDLGNVEDVFKHYLNLDGGKWMFEELIVQDPQMAAWHPSSVNTIRIPSVMTKDGPVVILPLFRTGKNGNVVDNCHNDGGLMSVPDEKTGVLVCDGYDVFQNVVETHPNSGMKFKGWQVPRWEELIATAAEIHKSLPKQHKYIGFDFALTSKGWIVVEGNWGNFPHQVCVGYGIRQEFERLMRS